MKFRLFGDKNCSLFSTVYTVAVFSVLSLLTACGGSSSPEASTGESFLRVYEGQEIDRGSAPQFVQVAIGNSRCSGTVIGSRSVLTASHCFRDESIGIESIYVQSGGQWYAAQNVYRAPNYHSDGFKIYNDIAVVELGDSFYFSPMPLFIGMDPSADAEYSIYGYGLDESGILGTLKSGTIQPDEVSGTHIIDEVHGGANTCAGDSGGPLLLTQFHPGLNQMVTGLLGITSSGTGGGCVNEETALYVSLQNVELLEFLVSVVPDVSML